MPSAQIHASSGENVFPDIYLSTQSNPELCFILVPNWKDIP